MGLLSIFRPSLNPVDVVVSLDLRDAFFLFLSIHFLGIVWGLSFGTSFTDSRLFPLGCAPLLGFHEKFSMVMAHLRRQGLRLFAFLDGCLLVAKSEVLLLDLSRVLFSTTQDL